MHSAAVLSAHSHDDARQAGMYVFEMVDAFRRGAIFVDIRSQAQRDREGTLPGALAIDPAVLGQRLDPASDVRLALAIDRDVEWVIVSSDGDTSARSVAALRGLGLHRVTDLVGGYRAIKAAGLLGALIGQRHCVRELATVASH